LDFIGDVYLFGVLQRYGTFFDELCLIMIGFDRGPMLRQGFAGQAGGGIRELEIRVSEYQEIRV